LVALRVSYFAAAVISFFSLFRGDAVVMRVVAVVVT